MTSRVVTLQPDDKVADALKLMHQHHIRNLPVVDEEGFFIGLFGVRRLRPLTVATSGPRFCTPDTTFPRMLELFDRSKDSSLPVIVLEGEARKLAGIVSMWDILEGLVMRQLMENPEAKSNEDEKK